MKEQLVEQQTAPPAPESWGILFGRQQFEEH